MRGSGVIIDKSGVILTSPTAVGSSSSRVTVLTQGGRSYTGKVLGPGEVKAWAHQLASYWYPSYNTDLVPPPKVWPAAEGPTTSSG